VAVSAGSAYINIDARLNDLEKTLKNKVPRAADEATKSAGKTMTAGFKRVAVGIGGLFVAQEVFSFAGDALAEAQEANKIGAETEQRIKSTGGAAGVTAGEVAKLSEELSLKAGVDDELVQSGANLILTFKNIRNAAGEGNDIFDQANSLALDLSKAFKTDLKSASIQVGKALDNPIKGITALSRVGVTFTEQQKEQIKALTESGDTISAQKIILAELESQVGGTAEATATASDRASVAWGNAKETLGTVLLPVVERVSMWIGEYLPRAVEGARAAFGRIKAFVDTNWPAIRDTIVNAVDTVAGYIRPVLDAIAAAWSVWGDNILRQLRIVWSAVRTVISSALDIIRGVFRVFAGVFTGDWSRAWSGVKDIFSGIWDLITGVFRYAWETLKNLAGAGIDAIVELFGGIGGRIGSALATLGEVITAPFRAAWNALASLWNAGPGSFSFSIPSWVPGIGGNTFDVPNLPTLHTGGIYTAPYGQTEGLAILEDGEGVFTQDQMRALGRRGSQQVTINNQFPTDPDVALAALRRAESLYAA
jgi:hypothetical protein